MQERDFLTGPWDHTETFEKIVRPKFLELINLCETHGMPVFASVAYKGDDSEVMTYTSSLKGPHHAHIYCLLDDVLLGRTDMFQATDEQGRPTGPFQPMDPTHRQQTN